MQLTTFRPCLRNQLIFTPCLQPGSHFPGRQLNLAIFNTGGDTQQRLGDPGGSRASGAMPACVMVAA